jgi:histidine triad (HIT) family protein
MSEDCIFCKIVRGEIPCAEVHATDTVLCFLDIAPVNPGHALVIPKVHLATLFDLPAALGQDLLHAMQVVGRAVMDATRADGLNVGMNNYVAAGQLVPHAHFHLIPRIEGDGHGLWPQKPYDSQEAMNALADAIRGRIGQ